MGAFVCSDAFADRLQVDASAHAVWHIFAAILLYLHIGGGGVGLVSGAVAAVARKGSNVHRTAGYAFVMSMAVSYSVGTLVAPFLEEGQRPNFVAGILALYLLLSGLASARQKIVRGGVWQRAGLLIALCITGMGLLFMYQANNDVTGTVDGAPVEAFGLFVVVGVLGAAGEINALMRQRLSRAARLRRHLWRMCMSFFIASGSLFFGQPQVFPSAFSESFAPIAFSFAPLLVMVVFLARSWFSAWRNRHSAIRSSRTNLG
ncbi:MAG: hypothetical protein AAF265_15475 [Pseudomonadota bacterium]